MSTLGRELPKRPCGALATLTDCGPGTRHSAFGHIEPGTNAAKVRKARRAARQTDPLFSCALSRRFAVALRAGVDAKFLADVGEFLWIGQPAVSHHRSQGVDSGLREKQPRQSAGRVQPQQAPLPDRNVITWAEVVARVDKPFSGAVIDEAQDISIPQLRLLAAIEHPSRVKRTYRQFSAVGRSRRGTGRCRP